jgi:hypothetical protein
VPIIFKILVLAKVTNAYRIDENDPWEKGKDAFQQVIRRGEYNKEVFSVNLYPENLIKHWDMISELNILCKKRRNLKVI